MKYSFREWSFAFLVVCAFSHKAEGGTQRVSAPAVMKTTAGFYNPTLKVCGDLDCETFHGEDCYYVAPTYVISFYKKDTKNNDKIKLCACQSPRACWESKYYELSNINKRDINQKFDGSGVHMVTSSYSADHYCSSLGGDEQLGCVDIPDAPSPPPFCDYFQKIPKTEVIPVSHANQSFFDRKTKVALVNNSPIICADSSTIPIGSTCKDGSSGTRMPLIENTSSVIILDHIDPKVSPYGNFITFTPPNDPDAIKHSYGSYSADGRTCTGYFGIANIQSSAATPDLVAEACFPAPKMQKPTVTAGSSAGSISVSIPQCSGTGCTKSLVPGATAISVGDAKIRAIRPSLDDDHNFRINILCPGGSAATRTSIPGSSISFYKCSKATDSPAASFIENAKTTAPSCLVGWNSNSKDYVTVNRNGRLFFLKKYGEGFIRKVLAKALSGAPKRIKCNSNNIKLDEPQSTFDTFIEYSSGSYYANIGSMPSSRAIALTIPTTEAEINTFCGQYANVYEVGDITQRIISPTQPQDKYSSIENGLYVSETEYYDIDTNQPFYLTQTEFNNKLVYDEIKPVDPYTDGLCSHSFASTNYNYTQGTSAVFALDSTKCDFISFEAWGGGEDGTITSAGTLGKTGASGSYISGAIKVPDTKSQKASLKIKVGRGAGTYSGSGHLSAEDTEIYFCSDATGINCQKVAVALAAGKTDAYSNLVNTTIVKHGFMKGSITGANINTASQINISVPYLNMDDRGKTVATTKCDHKTTNPVPSEDVNLMPGAGGCANISTGMVQNGTHGKARLTCELW